MRYLVFFTFLFAGQISAAQDISNVANQPFVECNDKDEILLSTSPDDHEFFLYIANESEGVASQIARSLRLGWSADRVHIKVSPSVYCQMKDESPVVGIETIRCTVGRGSSIKIHPIGESTTEKTLQLVGGTILFHHNIFFGGSAHLQLDLITADHGSVSISKNLDFRKCRVEGLSAK